MVAGVDGCRGGWVVVTSHHEEPDGPLTLTAEVVPGLEPVVERARRGELAAVGERDER